MNEANHVGQILSNGFMLMQNGSLIPEKLNAFTGAIRSTAELR
jgi:hypothetical protein